MSNPLSIVIAGATDRAPALLAILRDGGFALRQAQAASLSELVQAMAETRWDLILVVQDEPNSLELERVLAIAEPLRTPVIVVAASADPAAGRAALRAGAADVIMPAQIDRLPLAAERTLLQAARVENTAANGGLNGQPDIFSPNQMVQVLLDPTTGRMVDANAAAAGFYGFRLDELRGMPLWRLNSDENASTWADLLRAFAEPGGTVSARHRLADGRVRDVEIHASPVQHGSRLLVYGIVNDVTEQRQRERELETVSAFAAALRTAASRDTLVTVMVEQVRKLTGATGAALVLREAAQGEMALARGLTWPTAQEDLLLNLPRTPPPEGPETQSLVGQVTSNREAAWRVLQSAGDPLGAPQSFGVCVPLVAQDQTLGALCICAELPPAAAQVRLLSAMGDMAANALNRSTLYEQTEQRVQRLAALHAIDIAITASFDLRVTLGIFLDHLVGQMRVDAAAVLVLNNTTQTLEYVAVRGLDTGPLRQAPLRLTDSLPGRVATSRQALHLSNLNETRPIGTRPYPTGSAAFRSYYGLPLVAKGKVQGVLEILQRGPLHTDAEWVEFMASLGTQAAIAIDSANLFTDLQRTNVELNLAYDATIEGWSRVLEARGIESSGHTRRVADLTVRLAQAAGLTPPELIHCRRGALLHDIGMLSIPESVLVNTGPLTPAERAIIQQHPDYGFGILAPIVYLRPALDIPYCHHERWDGSGYPRGLAHDLIPLAARLFAVVDSWDALRTEKPYRPAWTADAALAHLQANAGTAFDPAAVRLLVEML